MSKWSEFYLKRINSTYQIYFENKYKELLNILLSYKTVREEGIGIGSVSKYLLKNNINTEGFDICENMLELCKLNNPTLNVWQDDIFKAITKKVDIVVTHGVLEHFNDADINKILYRYKCNNQKSVHYVPLNGYLTPSFEDERLLPCDYWLDTFKPKKYINKDNKDLIMLF